MPTEHLACYILEEAQNFKEKVALRVKRHGQWQETTYGEALRQIRAVAMALLELGVEEGGRVGIFSQNCPEWAVADLGILATRGVSVPIYATNTAAQARYIVGDAGLKVIFAGTQDHYDKLVSFIDQEEVLTTIIAFDEGIKLAPDHSMHLKDLLAMGEASGREGELEAKLRDATTDELATLIYTSGTTGEPKGVMLTHANFFHQLNAVRTDFDVGHDDRALCFLPLSHSFERSWSYFVLVHGAQNNYVENPREVVDYLAEVKPTAMVSVPRLYEKIHTTACARAEKASPLKRAIFHWAIETGKKYGYKKHRGEFIGPFLKLRHRLADRLVLAKIRGIVGGYKNFFASGGAALAGEIEEFFFAAGLLICQGYGLTETAPVLTCNNPNQFRFGTVGKPIDKVEIRISSEGEVLARGPNIMKGYFNKPEATREAFVDGWFRTGDIGVLDPDGYLRITDRIKDLIITSGGKNIAPQHIETVVGQDYYIEQIVAIGDGRNFISALVVPNFEALEEYARNNAISFSSREELVEKPEIGEFFRRRIDDQSRDLGPYERIKKFNLMPREFSMEEGELTPTLKTKRKVINEKYAGVIDAMYGGPAP